MRDANRLKEKIDLSLDNRQVMSLVIGGIVVLGAVFVVGVVVGKKLSNSERAQGAPDLLTALDQRATAMDEATDASLTFQDELTKKTAEPPRIEAPATPVAVATRLDPAPAPLPKPEPVAEVEPETPVAAAPRADEAVPTRTVLKDGGGLKEAIARSQRPVEAAANGSFTLQLSASQDRAEADRFMAKLKGQGYAPYLVEAQVQGRGTWYRVRMGSFPTKEAAGRYLQDFRRETQMEAFVAGSEVR